MQALLQRVEWAKVEVEGSIVGAIDKGILVFLGVDKEDTLETVEKMAERVVQYRVFSDDNGLMNLNVQQAQGSLLVVSQFTLSADTKKGLRPSFSNACPPKKALEIYEAFVEKSAKMINTQTGVFGAEMKVSLLNDGPVTFLLKS